MSIIFRLPLLDGSTEEVPIAGFIRHDEYVTAFRDTPEGHSAMLAFSMAPGICAPSCSTRSPPPSPTTPWPTSARMAGSRGTLLLECPRALMAARSMHWSGCHRTSAMGTRLSRPARRRGGHRRRPSAKYI